LTSKGCLLRPQNGVSTDTTKEIKKERHTERVKKRHTRHPKDSDPRVREFIAWFLPEYEARFGKPYHLSRDKDGRLIKNLLATPLSLEALKTAAKSYLLSDNDPFIVTGGHTIGIFAIRANAFIQPANGNGRGPQRSKENREPLYG